MTASTINAGHTTMHFKDRFRLIDYGDVVSFPFPQIRSLFGRPETEEDNNQRFAIRVIVHA